jgi:hypothetical protein
MKPRLKPLPDDIDEAAKSRSSPRSWCADASPRKTRRGKRRRGMSSIARTKLEFAAERISGPLGRPRSQLLAAVRPMLATSAGRLIALSTPRGKFGWFHDAWHADDESGWHRVRVSAKECPRISQAFLDEELRELGEQRFQEEYELAFLEDGQAVIRMEFFDRAVTDKVKRINLTWGAP